VNPIKRWSLVAAGCGTVNLASMRALARAGALGAFDTVGLIDPAVIRDVNAHTCPEYAGHRGKYKVARLAELMREWCGELNVTLFAEDVEDVDWKGLLAAGECACSWVGTKTNLHAISPGSRQFTRHMRRRMRVDGCLGPHSTATPMRPEDLFREEDYRHVCNV
jgi:hypothetical protein